MTVEENITDTLAYFDIFSQPLTAREVHRLLWSARDLSYQNILNSLDCLVRTDKTLRKEKGFFMLSSGHSSVQTREQRNRLVEKKMAIVRRAVKKLRWIPFLRAVFVCNQLQITAKPSSDIDVFIVVKQERLWITRLLATLLLSAFGLRRRKDCVKDHVCLSFYCTDDALDLSAIAATEPDIYLIYWLCLLIPLYDSEDVFSTIKNENQWVNEHVSARAWHGARHPRRLVQDSFVSRAVKRMFEIAWRGAYGDFIEAQAKALQKKKMVRNMSSVQHETTTNVIISDSMLKFHENDRRAFFFTQWKERRPRASG
jgi:hypothetical protein